MKSRIFHFAMATVALFAMSSCAELKEERTPVRFDFTVLPPSFDSSVPTKAIRKEWVKGDKMILFFNRNLADAQQAELVYDGNVWKTTFKDSEYMQTLPESGTLDAFYFEGGDMQMSFSNGVSKSTSDCENKIRFQAVDIPYKTSGQVVSAVLKMRYYENLVMVTVRGADANDGWAFYAEASPGIGEIPFNHIPGAYISETAVGAISSRPVNGRSPVPLLPNPDGASCYMEIWTEGYQSVNEYVFHLKKGTTEYVKTFHHQIQPPCEIIFDVPEMANDWNRVNQ